MVVGELGELRRQLSALDGQILGCFSKRMELSEQVAQFKMKHQGTVFVPEQEQRKIEEAKNSVPLPLREYAGALTHTLLRLSREKQYELILEQDQTWELGNRLTQAQEQSNQVRSVVTLGGFSLDQLYPGAQVILAPSVDGLIHQVKEGLADVALLPLTDENLKLVERRQLYIQARLPRHLAVGPKFIIPANAERICLSLPQPQTIRDLATIVSLFADLDLPINNLRVMEEALIIEFSAAPDSQVALRAIYQLEQETENMLVLGWYPLLDV